MATPAAVRTDSRRSMQPTRGQAWFAFIVLLSINILNYADREILPAVLPKIQNEFHLTSFESGLLGSSFLFVYALATFPLGVLADKGSRKNIVAGCVAVWSVATAMAGFTYNFIQIFLVRSVLGIGEAGYGPASLSMIGDFFPRGSRGRVLSLWSIGNLIGTAIGLVIGGYIADALNWRWAFYVVGIPGLFTAFLIWRAVEPRRGAFESEGAAEESAELGHGSIGGKNFGQTLRRIVRIPTYWILVGAFIFSFFTIGSAQFWIPSYISDIFHLSLKQSGSISGAVLAGGALVGTLLGGFLGDFLQRRLPQGRMIVSALAFLAGSPLTFIALSLRDLVPFIATFVLAIVCLSMCLGPLNAIVQDIIAPEIRSTAFGIILLLAHLLGDAASPTLIGLLADHITLGNAFLVTAPTCLLIAGIICLIGIKTVAKDMDAMHQSIDVRRQE